MKKSFLLVLSLPLILAGCSFVYDPQSGSQTQDPQTQETEQTSGEQTEQGTEGSGSQTQDQTEGGSGSESQSGGSSEQGSGTGTEIGGDTGSEDESESGSETGGGTQTQSTTVKAVMSEMGFTDQKDVKEFKMADDLNVTLSRGQGSADPKYYNNGGALRIYGKNTMTFTCEAFKITKIVFQITSDSGDNNLKVDTGSISSDRTTWTGSANSITFTVEGASGKICISTISVTYGGSGSGGGSGTSSETGGDSGTGGSGGSQQSGNGNTSHSFTSPWTGDMKDIAYSLFKGILPCLTAFNKYTVGDMDGSTIPFFNPYIESNWSKDSQTNYDLALKEMGYSFIEEEPYVDLNGTEYPGTPVYYYQKGTYHVQTVHYQGDKNVWYFDVYAYNDYQAPFEIDYEPKVDLNASTFKIGKGNKQYSQTINGITFKMNQGCENAKNIQIAEGSSLEINSTSVLSKMDVIYALNAGNCIIYAGTSANSATPVYNDGGHYDFPSGTKYVKLRTLNEHVQIEDLTII